MSVLLTIENAHQHLGTVNVPLVVTHGVYVLLEVEYFNEYMRGADGRCALCSADYFEEEETAAEGTALRLWHDTTTLLGVDDNYDACPVCDGRPI